MLPLNNLQKIIFKLLAENPTLLAHGFKFTSIIPKNSPLPILCLSEFNLTDNSSLSHAKYEVNITFHVLTAGNSNLLCLTAMEELEKLLEPTSLNQVAQAQAEQFQIDRTSLTSVKAYYKAEEGICIGELYMTINLHQLMPSRSA